MLDFSKSKHIYRLDIILYMCVYVYLIYIYIGSKAVFYRYNMIIGHHRAGTAMTLPRCLAHGCGNDIITAKVVDKAMVAERPG